MAAMSGRQPDAAAGHDLMNVEVIIQTAPLCMQHAEETKLRGSHILGIRCQGFDRLAGRFE